MAGAPTVFIVEDEPEVRETFLELIRREGFSARGFASGEDFLAVMDLPHSSCLVLDMRLPAMQGAEVLRQLKLRNAAIPVVVVTGFGDVPSAVDAMKAGAVDYLQKPVDPRSFVAAVRAALRLNEEKHTEQSLAQAAKDKLAALSDDERSVYRLLLSGNSNKQIAANLQIGLRTVELRRANLLKKMEAGSLPELVRLAILGGLSQEPPS